MRDPIREEEFESRWEASPAVALVIAGQVMLALVSKNQDWKLWHFPWWVWLIPAALLDRGFGRDDVAKIMGMNMRRLLEATLG